MRARTAAIVLGAAVLWIALPAGAQRPIEVEITSPGEGQIVAGTIEVKARASAPTGVERAELTIDGTTVADAEPEVVKQEVVLTSSWNTAVGIGTSSPVANGEYVILMEATANGGASDKTSRRVFVDNPPRPPQGFTVLSPSGGRVTLDWTANREPDITGYIVERAQGDSWVTVVETGETTATESIGAGTHTYRVTASRSSPVNGTIASAPSEPVAVTVAAAPRTFGSGGSGAARGSVHDRVKGTRIERGDGFAGRGLPSGVALPSLSGSAGLPPLPELDWGTYEQELPYELPAGGIPLEKGYRIAARVPWRIIPPDGLRWVAAGILSFVTAAILRFVAARVIAA